MNYRATTSRWNTPVRPQPRGKVWGSPKPNQEAAGEGGSSVIYRAIIIMIIINDNRLYV